MDDTSNLPKYPAISITELQAFHQTHYESQPLPNADDGSQDIVTEKQIPSADYNALENGYDYAYNEDGEENEDDGLGYYQDGVKRTLTDEQIAIFRHTEIEELRKAQERKGNSRNSIARASLGVSSPQGSDSDQATRRMRNSSSPELESSNTRIYEDRNDAILLQELNQHHHRRQGREPHLAVLEPAANTTRGTKKKKKKRKKKKKPSKELHSNMSEVAIIPPKHRLHHDVRKRTWDVVETGLGNLDYGEVAGETTAAQNSNQRRRIAYDDD